MSRDATATREALLRAGERRFARDGVSGARLIDIVRDAGQANESAVSYHFKSRRGLLTEIVDKYIAIQDLTRVTDLDEGDVGAIVQAIVAPTAELLRTDEGRDFLRIMEQLSSYAGIRATALAGPIRGTALESQLGTLERALRHRMGAAYTNERIAAMIIFLTAALADRARSVERDERNRLSHARYVEHLVSMLTGALEAG